MVPPAAAGRARESHSRTQSLLVTLPSHYQHFPHYMSPVCSLQSPLITNVIACSQVVLIASLVLEIYKGTTDEEQQDTSFTIPSHNKHIRIADNNLPIAGT